MAILKHGSIKNGDYGEAQRYLLFEHDPVTQKPIRDEQGNMVMRKGYIQSGLNCDPFTFNTECTELNRRFRKNQGRKEVKAHHYILSFAPQDVTERGLTPQKAHVIAEEFAGRFFAGHQVLLVTHTDGHNHSGNIHTHMVLNSVRKENVVWQDFMERPADAQAGYKHHQSRELLRRMEQAVNEICEREHLSTVDYSLPTEKKVTDREYRAKQDGQDKLEEINEKVQKAGLKPRQTEYETIKDKIRAAVDAAVREANSEADFLYVLRERYHVEVKTSRGSWSYIHSDRAKPIRDRSLGRTYDRESVLKRIKGFRDMPDVVRPEYAALPKIFLIHSELRLVTDLQTCVKAQQSWAYTRKVMISNLQEMAHTVAWIQEQGIDTREELMQRSHDADVRTATARNRCAELDVVIQRTNEDIRLLGGYLSGKAVFGQFLKAEDKARFRQNHAAQIAKYEEAVRRLKETYPDGFPSMKTLREQKARYVSEQREEKRRIKAWENRARELEVAVKNVSIMIDVRNPVQQKTPEVHQHPFGLI